MKQLRTSMRRGGFTLAVAGLLVPAVAAMLALSATQTQAAEGAGFLRIGVGARALGMAGAYTGVAQDLSAIYWNPAGLAGLEKREAAGMHAELGSGMRYDFLGFGQKTGHGTIAAGLSYLGQGAMEGRDEQGRVTGGYSAADTALTLGMGRHVLAGLSLGGSVKFVRSTIASHSGQSVAADVGSAYDVGALGPGKLRLGLAVLNMGPGMTMLSETTQLPLAVAAGLGYHFPGMGFTVGFDVKTRPYARSAEVSMGTEYALGSSLALRAGYASSHGAMSGSTKANDLAGLAAGFGVKAYGIGLDYSMTPFGGLGNSHRISLGARF